MSNTPDEPVVAWVTKYALSQGVIKVRGDVRHSINSSLFHVTDGPMSGANFHGRDWHRTEALATARVREMVLARRKALAREVAKLDAIEQNGAELTDQTVGT